MKSKRFTTLIAIFVISLLACALTFGVTASADEAAATDVSAYFEMPTGVSAEIVNNEIVFTFDGTITEAVTITSKNTFDLVNVNVAKTEQGGTATTNTGAGAEAGKLEITFTPRAGDTMTLTVTGITTKDSKALYAIENGVLTAKEDAITVGALGLAEVEALVWGYNYENVTFDLYHGFIADADLAKKSKEIVIAYGADEATSAANATEYFDGTATEGATFVVAKPLQIRLQALLSTPTRATPLIPASMQT